MKKDNKCVIPECNRDVYIQKHRLCKTHANRLYRFGDPGGKIKDMKKHKPYWPMVLNKRK